MRGIRVLGASVGLGLAGLVLLVCVSVPAPPISRGAALRGPDQSAVIQTTRNISPSIPGSVLPTSIDSLLQSDISGEQTAAILLPDVPNTCPAPLVLHGSIITGTSPVYLGRLIRNGVPSLCGQSYDCSGVQSTSTPFSYQTFSFINSSSNWQCVQVAVDARSCTQQVYSAAYLNTFNSADLCQNIQGAMGFSTQRRLRLFIHDAAEE